MPAIDNPLAIKFVNETARRAAWKMLRMYRDSQAVITEYWARPTGTIPDTDDVIEDGAHSTGGHIGDGRPEATGAQVVTFVGFAEEYVAWMEANDNARLNTVLTLVSDTVS